MTDSPSSGETAGNRPQAVPAGTAQDKPAEPAAKASVPAVETGGPKGPEPTRYGDWERKGRCIDF